VFLSTLTGDDDEEKSAKIDENVALTVVIPGGEFLLILFN
jgi:hypothetical protein